MVPRGKGEDRTRTNGPPRVPTQGRDDGDSRDPEQGQRSPEPALRPEAAGPPADGDAADDAIRRFGPRIGRRDAEDAARRAPPEVQALTDAHVPSDATARAVTDGGNGADAASATPNTPEDHGTSIQDEQSPSVHDGRTYGKARADAAGPTTGGSAGHAVQIQGDADAGEARILAAIPAYNEEIAIASVVHKATPHVDEVVVIDDGSDDDTADVARAAGARVVTNPGNKGKGYSVRRAFRYARDAGFDVLVLLDGDGQHDADEIPDLVEPVLGVNGYEDPRDVALGFRVGDDNEMPLYRRVGKRVLDYATATASGDPREVTDSQCGFRAFGPRAIEIYAETLTDDGFSVESEQLVVAREQGLTWENVRVSCRYEGVKNRSTHGPVKHALGVLDALVEKVTRKRPLLYMGLPSVLMMVAGGGLGIYVLQWWNWTGYFSVPQAMGAAVLLLVGMMGVMAALILNMMVRLERRESQQLT